jgi:hypothetical protein
MIFLHFHITGAGRSTIVDVRFEDNSSVVEELWWLFERAAAMLWCDTTLATMAQLDGLLSVSLPGGGV